MANLLHEIRSQHPTVRLALFIVSSFVAISVVGYYWFTDFERTAYIAIHTDPAQQEAFLARQQERSPKVLARITGALGSMTAAIGNLLGFDSSKGIDGSGQTGDTSEPVYTLPLAE